MNILMMSFNSVLLKYAESMPQKAIEQSFDTKGQIGNKYTISCTLIVHHWVYPSLPYDHT